MVTYKEKEELAKFLFELAMLKHTFRTGYSFLGSGQESCAAHSYNTAMLSLILARMIPDTDVKKVLLMALIHDLPEARVGDANAVHKKYLERKEKKALEHGVKRCFVCDDFLTLFEEFEEGKTIEARIVKDADQLDMIISLKEQLDCGNPNSAKWIPYVLNRLKTKEAREIGELITKTDWASWWMDDYEEEASK